MYLDLLQDINNKLAVKLGMLLDNDAILVYLIKLEQR